MKDKRLLELLANASFCFDKCMSPFSHSQLVKNNVLADECRDLSVQLGSIVEEWLREVYNNEEVDEALKKAEEMNKDE